MKEFKAKNPVHVNGKMNPNDSARIARIYTIAALVFSTCLGLAALIAAVLWELILK